MLDLKKFFESDGVRLKKFFENVDVQDIGEVCNTYQSLSWKSKLHHDGKVPFGGGWFIVGIDTPKGQYTYHYELKDWDLFKCKELDKAPEWDGHTDQDVERLLSLSKGENDEQF